MYNTGFITSMAMILVFSQLVSPWPILMSNRHGTRGQAGFRHPVPERNFPGSENTQENTMESSEHLDLHLGELGTSFKDKPSNNGGLESSS